MSAVVAEHSKIFTFGWMGVWLFYVISGFVVTSSIRANRVGHQPMMELLAFYARRAARILPLYMAWVAVAACIQSALSGHVPWPAILSLVAFYNNFALSLGFGDMSNFSVANLWTISVEMQFYGIFGLVLVVLPRRLAVGLLMATIFLAPAARWLYGIHLADNHVPPLNAAFAVYSFSFLHFDAFAYGALIALFRHRVGKGLAATVLALGLMSGAAIFSYFHSVNSALGQHGLEAFKNIFSGILYGQHREAFIYLPVVWVSAGLIMVAIAYQADKVRHDALTWIASVGEVSYGAYIFHVAALTVAGLMFSHIHTTGILTYVVRLGFFLTALSLSVSIAFLSYRWFEQPIAKATGRLLRRVNS